MYNYTNPNNSARYTMFFDAELARATQNQSMKTLRYMKWIYPEINELLTPKDNQ